MVNDRVRLQILQEGLLSLIFLYLLHLFLQDRFSFYKVSTFDVYTIYFYPVLRVYLFYELYNIYKVSILYRAIVVSRSRLQVFNATILDFRNGFFFYCVIIFILYGGSGEGLFSIDLQVCNFCDGELYGVSVSIVLYLCVLRGVLFYRVKYVVHVFSLFGYSLQSFVVLKTLRMCCANSRAGTSSRWWGRGGFLRVFTTPNLSRRFSPLLLFLYIAFLFLFKFLTRFKEM